MVPDLPLAAAPAPFVQDFIANDRPVVITPSDKRIHLDFESGVGGYAVSYAQRFPDAHVITVDDGTLTCTKRFTYAKEKDESGRTSFAKLWRTIHDAVRAIRLNEGLKRFTSRVAQRRSKIRSAADSGAFDYWHIERDAIEYSAEHHVAAMMATQGLALDKDPMNPSGRYWQLSRELKAEVFLKNAQQTYGMWRNSYADRIRRNALNEAITPEEVFFALQRRYLEEHFETYAPDGKALPNMTVMRAPTAVESGFNGIPLPDDSVHSITWIGPFRHADDHRAIMDEFRRVLAPDWTSVEIGVYDRDPELDFPRAALDYGAQIFGAAAQSNTALIHPLQGSMFDASNLAFYCYTNSALLASPGMR